MNKLLECRDIRKIYREASVSTEVLKGVSFDIDKGELVSIVGSSGSGKSTLLHILGALDEASRGEVDFLGQNLSALTPNEQAVLRNKHLGFVYQFHHLLSDFTAIENVSMPLLIGGTKVSIARTEAKALLEKVGLGHRMDHRPAELSGGERQRVAIARALVSKPDLVLADEPTGNLDHTTALKVYDLMRELSIESNVAFLVVTHDNELAVKMDRQMYMRDGLLVNRLTQN
ncbi:MULTISPECIES: lipoprotein-releasing ABC transporter ATP-binding protein LolD [Vibrio]|uniref:Lipoprotein-releasing system ATP-binding protein LolD n=2 Tax=Vibrio TaxID=662 RepID=A0A2S3R1M5_VIBVL|nr:MULTISPECIES: lipoprotein-releasing ABC transporter ATP-binding protein LolD [Vibrio]KIF53161.1 ABC transporter [Vibrio owensii CAIM 1854 = LMG 25443]PAW02293.1 lipoprotein-releasing system ATP-binding protein LolD [Vibrio coralliilyticus]POB47011.1 lipoprotein-releasing system ATP-binding protein LolD [Vibrio vulnificus]